MACIHDDRKPIRLGSHGNHNEQRKGGCVTMTNTGRSVLLILLQQMQGS